jgi:hypothetical protein
MNKKEKGRKEKGNRQKYFIKIWIKNKKKKEKEI